MASRGPGSRLLIPYRDISSKIEMGSLLRETIGRKANGRNGKQRKFQMNKIRVMMKIVLKKRSFRIFVFGSFQDLRGKCPQQLGLNSLLTLFFMNVIACIYVT